MQYVLIWAFNVFAVPLLVLAAAHYLLKKHVWMTPMIVTLIAAAEFFVQVREYSHGEPLKEQFRLYFHNDVSMGIIIQYVPMIIVGIICTILYYMIVKGSKTANNE